MPFADAGGVKIYYEVVGQGDPLVLIQGYGHNLLHWGTLPAEFAKLQYQVTLIDNRGVGRSDKPDAPVTIAGMADDVCKVLDDLSIKKASVFGVSMGGMIAQEFALNHADRLVNLVLGCTTCGGPHSVPPTPEGAKILFDYNYLAGMTPEQRSREIFRFLCTDEFIDSSPEDLRYYHEVTTQYPTPLYVFVRQAQAISTFDAWERLPRIKSPTMIICGTSDQIIPFKNSEILEERIPGAELTLLQDKLHSFFIEARDSTRIFVHGFMKRHGKK
ncbi:MAG: alpha/beta hydrolase [Dehalococcoidia bacterium]|jgi:pimeloyl-ACP methyl ester carboxylesterase